MTLFQNCLLNFSECCEFCHLPSIFVYKHSQAIGTVGKAFGSILQRSYRGIILHFLYESAICGGSGKDIHILADWHPNRCRTLRKYSRIITYPCRIDQTLRINLPYTLRMPLPCRMAIRSIRIHYVSYELHYVPSSTIHTKRTVSEHKQSTKLPFGYESRRISHSSPQFLITMKNSIQDDHRNRNDCSMMRLVEENSLALVPFSKFRFHLPGKK